LASRDVRRFLRRIPGINDELDISPAAMRQMRSGWQDHGSFPADVRRRRQREQQPRETDFLSVGRSAFSARRGHTTSLSGGGPASVRILSDFANGPRAATLAQVAAGPGLATAPTARNLGHTAQRRPNPGAWAKRAQITHPEAGIGLESTRKEAHRP
jgi:hypothetical protein